MIILMGLMFLSCSQPMGLVFLMIMITLMYSLYMYIVMGTFWYSFILMLIMMSGVLVVFTYLTSLEPNDKYDLSMMPMLFLLIFIVVGLEKWYGERMNLAFSMWDFSVMMMNLYIISFLLVIMLMVVWMSMWWFGPVRGYWQS